MNLDELKKYTKGFIEDHPHHRNELVDLFLLAQAEVEDGEPEHSECELAYCDMKKLCES